MAAGFRVSDHLRYLALVPQYNALLSQQLDYERAIATGKKLARADQDPLGAGLTMRYHQEDARLNQNLRNIQSANDFSQMTGSALNSFTQSIQRAWELSVSGGDGSKTAADRATLAQEIEGLLKGMVDTANLNHRGEYIFGGSETLQPPFTANLDANGDVLSVDYNGNDARLDTEFAPGSTVAYNIVGSALRDVDTAAATDLFNTMITLRDNLRTNPAGLVASMGDIQKSLTHMTTLSASTGALQNRLNSATTVHEDSLEQLSKTTSKVEDTDMAEAISKLTTLQTSYQAALSVGARMSDVSLLNYLR